MAGCHPNAGLQKALRAEALSFDPLECLNANQFGNLLGEVLLRREAWWMEHLRPSLNIEGPRLPPLDMNNIRSRLSQVPTHFSLREEDTNSQSQGIENAEDIKRRLDTAQRNQAMADTAYSIAKISSLRLGAYQVGAAALFVGTLGYFLDGEASAGSFLTQAGLTCLIGSLIVALRDDPNKRELARRAEEAQAETKMASHDPYDIGAMSNPNGEE